MSFPLNYFRSTPAWHGYLLIAVVGTAVLTSGIFVLNRAAVKIHNLYWQAKCMSFDSGTALLFNNRDDRMDVQSVTNPAELDYTIYRYPQGAQAIASAPPPLQEIPYWLPTPRTAIFLHRVSREDGTLRLVIVRPIYGFDEIGTPSIVLHADVCQPATLFARYRILGGNRSPGMSIPVPDGSRLTMKFGRGDPNKASRFFIGYNLDGNEGVISGHLNNDDSIDLSQSPR